MCFDCKKKFTTIQNVNQHITKTGCNEKRKVTIEDYFSDQQINELENSSYKYFRRKF